MRTICAIAVAAFTAGMALAPIPADAAMTRGQCAEKLCGSQFCKIPGAGPKITQCVIDSGGSGKMNRAYIRVPAPKQPKRR